MARKPEPNPVRVVTDPNREPVCYVDQVTCHTPFGSEVSLTLCTFMDVPAGEDGFRPEAVITARLRMKVGMARLLVDGLAKQIAMAEAAEGTVN